jgi:hypothetical protein
LAKAALCELYQRTGHGEPDFCREGEIYQCSDGIDNDVDGRIDLDDPGCWADIDDDETDMPIPAFEDQIVFITSETYTGNLGGVLGADAKCQTLAGQAGLPGLYLAWISDYNANNEPAARFNKYFLRRYVLADGVTVVADDWDDLTDGYLHYPINMDENRFFVSDHRTFTNVNWDGTVRNFSVEPSDCQGWTSEEDWLSVEYRASGGSAVYGPDVGLGKGWWSNYWSGSCSNSLRLYCVQQ